VREAGMSTEVVEHGDDVVPELQPLYLEPKPDGPGAAAMLAAGIGIFVLGILTILNEASVSVHDFLEDFQGSAGVGPLAGKTILASGAFFVAWAILGVLWWKKAVDIRKVFYVGLALGILGAVAMFPPIFEAFAQD
jgi:hypothetical protein